MERFEGKRVLVTGATSGIGQATAVRLAAEGATVVGLGRTGAGLEKTRALLGAPDRFHPILADLTDEESLIQAVDQTIDRLGSLDVVANVAGMNAVTPVESMTTEELSRVFAVNAFGPILLCREALGHITDGTGVILNVCSTSATQAHPGMTAYAASKAALLSYSLSLAVELAPRRIRVVAISPGGVRTPMMQGQTTAVHTSWYPRLTPVWGQVGEPEEIAGAIAFAASADGGYLNGTEIRLDGGARSSL